MAYPWLRLAWISALTLGIGARGVAGSSVRFEGLGDLPGGEFWSLPLALSEDGSVVVGTSEASEGRRAFRWTRERGMRILEGAPGPVTPAAARGVSGDGSVIVGTGVRFEAFRWTESEGALVLRDFPGSYDINIPRAVSGDGSTIVGFGVPEERGQEEAYRWTREEGLVGIGVPPGERNSDAYGVSADGSVIVGLTQGMRGGGAFRWTRAEGMIGLDPEIKGAEDVSADGSVIVGQKGGILNLPSGSIGIGEACRWTKSEGVEGLGLLLLFGLPGPGVSIGSIAHAVSADGSVLVGSEGKRELSAQGAYVSVSKPILWDRENGLRDLQAVLEAGGLDLAGWQLQSAEDVSADGRTIIGRGLDPEGHTQGWIAILPLDADGDGVEDPIDACPGTAPGEPVDPTRGCSLAQLCACEASQLAASHGKYVSCVARAVVELAELGVLTPAEAAASTSEAAQSPCGRR